MTEQWFLDLDGTKSGPYHTPEILSLIAEGEVLPHHRISTGLKDHAWVTVLDWRLEQAKLTQTSSPRPPREAQTMASPVALSAPAKSEKFDPPHRDVLDEGDALPLIDVSDWSLDEGIGESSEEKTQTDFSRPADFSKTPAPEPQATKAKPAAKKPSTKAEFEPSPARAGPANPEPSLPDGSSPPVKRDPMAEMFDMLQKTKQKKESRSRDNFQPGLSIEADAPADKKMGGLAKTLGVGAGIILIGFALGQLFQNTTPPSAVSTASTPAPKPAAEPTTAPAARAKTELVDRSTDKLTIRANVERHLETAAPAAAPAKPAGKTLGHASSAEIMQNEKELEELKSLKKELQELKNMKSNSLTPDDLPDSEGDGFDNDPNSLMQNSFSNPNGEPGGATQEPPAR